MPLFPNQDCLVFTLEHTGQVNHDCPPKDVQIMTYPDILRDLVA